MLRLRCMNGPLQGREFEFEKGPIVVGRGKDCEVMLDDGTCSRQHARIEYKGGEYLITDLESANGMMVNEDSVRQAVLRTGDRITIGRTSLLFEFEAITALVEIPGGTHDNEVPVLESVTLRDVTRHIESLQTPSDDSRRTLDSAQFKELTQAHRMLHVAYRVSQAISTTLDKEDLYELLTDQILKNFEEVERVCFFIRYPETTHLELVKNVCRSQENLTPVSRSVLSRVEKEQIGILANDAWQEGRFAACDSIVRMKVSSLMCVPLLARNKFVGVLYVENSTRPGCFNKADLELLTLLGNQAAFAIDNATLYEDIQLAMYESVRSLSNALEAKDTYTRGHSDRVADYCIGIGHELGLGLDRLATLRTAAELHDIGKIAIREEIIGKNGRLTETEYRLIQKHPQLGVNILKPIRFLEPALPFIKHHHERYNGEGYPDGLKGDDIPLEARIINLADAFDAMTTKRSYNVPKSFEEALEVCKKEAGVSFDADCVKALVEYLKKVDTADLDSDTSHKTADLSKMVSA